MRDNSTTIQSLKDIVEDFRTQRGWKNDNQKEIAVSLLVEASELLQNYKWSDRTQSKADKDRVAEELCDVLWWVLIMADSLGINLSFEFEKKTLKNAQKYPLTR